MDVDLTLLECQSFKHFLYWKYLRTGRGQAFALLRLGLWRKLRRFDRATFKARSLSILHGLHRAEIEALGATFSDELASGRMRPGAWRRLTGHRKKGTPIYLISASPAFYVTRLAERLGVAGAIATELQFNDDGIFVGGFRGGDCWGEEKARRVLELATREHFDLRRAVFYTDSAVDLPLLERVGRPVAVWPDRRLRSVCKERSWPVEYW